MTLSVANWQTVIWWLSSAAIVGVVLVMAACCLLTMRWVPRRWQAVCDRMRVPEVHCDCTLRESLIWPAAAIAGLWTLIVVGYWLQYHTLHNLFNYIPYRFAEQGDAAHYLFIAENGYPSEGNDRLFIVFYPLLPLCIRLLHGVLRLPYMVAGMLISHACLGVSAVLMRHLAGTMLPKPGARAATAAMLLYPYVFFCFGVYTESLFMALALGCLLLLRKRRWWPAGVLALLATLCRTQGFALTFACLYAYLSTDKQQRGPRTGIFASMGAPVGFGMYLCLNWVNSGDPFRFLEYQKSNWYHETRWFGDNLAEQLGGALTHEGMQYTTFWPQIVLFFLTIAVVTVLFARHKRSPEGVYSVAFLGMSYISSWLISGGRYMFGCVGLYLALGMIKNRVLRMLLLLPEAACLIVFCWQYFGNAPMW